MCNAIFPQNKPQIHCTAIILPVTSNVICRLIQQINIILFPAAEKDLTKLRTKRLLLVSEQ